MTQETEFNQSLLELVRCPITRSRLALADEHLVARLNEYIRSGTLQDKSGAAVEREMDAGLVNEEASYLVPIRRGIVTLLAAQAIWIKQ